MNKVLIVNEFFSDNVGDIAIGDGICAALKESYGREVEIIKLGLQRGQIFNGVRPASTLKSADGVHRDFSFIYHAAWTLRYIFRILKVLPSLKASDFAIIGGGGVIMDNRLQFPTASFILMCVFKVLAIPYAVSGVSMSGAHSHASKWLWTKVLRSAYHIDMRDPVSIAKSASVFGIEAMQGSDYALCLSDLLSVEESKAKHKEYKVALNVSSSVARKDEYLLYIEKSLKKWSGYAVLLVTTGDRGDEEIAISLKRKFPSERFDLALCKTYMEYIGATSRADVLIATRLHGAILGLMRNLQIYIIDIGYKQSGFFNGLDFGSRILDINSEPRSYSELNANIYPKNPIVSCLKICKKNIYLIISGSRKNV